MESIHRKISKFANPRSTIILFSLSLLLMVIINTVNMPVSVQRINELSNKAGILDMKFYYTSSEAYQLLEGLQPKGRSVYMLLLIVFDFVFPILYSLSLALIVAVSFRSVFPGISNLQKLYLIPLLAGLCDWLENVGILTMLARYPKFVETAHISGYFTMGKWIFTGLGLILATIGIVGVVGLKIKSSIKNQKTGRIKDS